MALWIVDHQSAMMMMIKNEKTVLPAVTFVLFLAI